MFDFEQLECVFERINGFFAVNQLLDDLKQLKADLPLLP